MFQCFPEFSVNASLVISFLEWAKFNASADATLSNPSQSKINQGKANETTTILDGINGRPDLVGDLNSCGPGRQSLNTVVSIRIVRIR